MASSDARPLPIKNAAYRHTFAIYNTDGTLLTGATGLDSEISKDAGGWVDCTNEATEIGSSGIYTLDLTSTEMNADTVAVVVKTTSSSAAIPAIILYPQEAGDIPVNVTYWKDASVATPDTAGYPKTTIKSGSGIGELTLSSGGVALSTSGLASAADAVWDEDITGHRTANSAGIMLQPVHSGTCQAGGSSTEIVLASAASSVDDFYNFDIIEISDGTNKVVRFIDDYVGSTRVATVAAMTVSPGITYTYVVKGFGQMPGATAPSASDNAAAVWNATRASYVSAGSFGQAIGGQITRSGTAQNGTVSSITLDSGASSTDNIYRYHSIEIVSGTGAGQASYITGYTGASKVATIDPAFVLSPDNTSVFNLRKQGLDAATPAQVADAVWDEPRSGHSLAGTYGEYIYADVARLATDATAAVNCKFFFNGTGYAGTNNVIPTVTQVTGAVGSVTGNVGGNVVGSVASVTGNVGGNVAGSVASVTGAVGSVTGAVGSVTGAVGSVTAGVTLTNAGIDALFTRALTESYAADGAAPTVAQALLLIQQRLGDFSISGTTITVNRLDGTTPAATYTLNDGSSPTASTRAS